MLPRDEENELRFARAVGAVLIALGVSFSMYQFLLMLPYLPRYGKYLLVSYSLNISVFPFQGVDYGVVEMYGIARALVVGLFVVVFGLFLILEYYTYRIRYCLQRRGV